MKKRNLIIGIILLILTFGCTMQMGNSPTSKVEELLKKYNSNHDIVKGELGDYLNSLNLDHETLEIYQEIYLRQYSDLTYEIKDERIDGDRATVTVQIKVYDYYSAENLITNHISTNQRDFYDDDDVYDPIKAKTYRIENLRKVKDKIEYTIEFTLTKINDEWIVDNLTNEQLDKIHGMYAH